MPNHPPTLGRRKDNFSGCGIQAFKNQAKAITSEIDQIYRKNLLGIESLRIIFDSRKLVVDYSEEEISFPNARFISRSFLNAGYQSLTILSWHYDTKTTLKMLLELGEEEKIIELQQILVNLPSSVVPEKVRLGTFPPLIPGSYKHYTDQYGFEGITTSGLIRGVQRYKNGVRDFYVSLTRLSLTPKEVTEVLFTPEEMEEIPDRGEYVISFNLKDGSPQVHHLKSDRSLEGWVVGNLYLRDVELVYAGKNHLVQVDA
jgi:hypothetical protein